MPIDALLIQRRFVLRLAAVAMAGLLGGPIRAAESLTVFAAASLKNVIDDAAKAYTAKTGIEIRASYAASSVLARQIEQGAPADLFASADLDWMDYLEKKNLIKAETRVNLLGNSLVLIAPKSSPISILPLEVNALTDALGGGRLVTGDINSVPVGKYAKIALQSLNLWPAVEAKIAGADSVRSALSFVAKGEAPLGIVYGTDAAVEPDVKVVATFPESSHPPVIYPFAVTLSGKNQARDFLNFLRRPEITAIFAKSGFTVTAKPNS
jgi:molybdate transport system substrate-binding protein